MSLGPQGGRASSTLTIISPVVGVHIFLHFLFHFLLDDYFSFSDFLNDFFWKDEVPLWIWERKNLRLVLMTNKGFFFLEAKKKI